ncbi:MAG: ROK family protein [Actinomycetes bacterium]
MNRLCVGIDPGGTLIKVGLVEDGQVTNRAVLTSESAAGLAPKLPALRELVDRLVSGRTVDSIGMAMPGIVDRRTRRVTAINAKWSDATELDLQAWASACWGVPLVLENDAVAALAGEWRFGAGAGADGVVMMTLGTGIGVAAVVDGRLLRGSHGQAAIGDTDDPGRCFAVEAGSGERVVVPPGWAHATISADSSAPLTFGAWCVRDYGVDYAGVRAHGGLAWFPVLSDRDGAGHEMLWRPNPAYPTTRELDIRPARDYPELGLQSGVPIYRQYLADPERMNWVPRPDQMSWTGFVP